MKINLNKIKILKKFNLYTLYGFTNKLNFYYSTTRKYISYKLVKNIQILKTIYNLKNKRLNNYLEYNIYKLIDFLKILKSRVDYILLESELFLTLNHIRQNIIHRHILLNNKTIINYSYIISTNDIIHLLNFDINKTINIIIYNFLFKNLKAYYTYRNICKKFKNKKYIKTIVVNKNSILFGNYVCYKNFKVLINSYKSFNYTSIPSYIINRDKI
ncbi:Ribosomal protein S4 superfamily protein (apicoplast) [Babesia bovis T2Bo]|uniref:RNA-binding S4 domain-containing protein n=1 Tax=Babesia bovis TaxID=5865 RepID=A7AXH2_BABBO|nr:Ribosomal protein S4 superfamily protein [Babesia bovis T2Bo]EDO05095.1 Ribosomal protein S4 superfamily protein [Babesia bovis T2Bo]|eukprot:YP_002290875.1 hypothetical protein BBOV_V000540 (apicoplast) [Babesia bovis T2Bo]